MSPDVPVSLEITGKVYCVHYGIGIYGASVYFAGNGIEKTLTADYDGRFVISDLPAGRYLLRAGAKGFVCKPDSVEIVLRDTSPPFVTFYSQPIDEYERITANKVSVICGRICTREGLPVSDVLIVESSNQNGYFSLGNLSMGKPVVLVPRKEGYSFKPDSLVVVPEEPIEIVSFTASYSGPPVHSISGSALIEGIPMGIISVKLMQDGVIISHFSTETNGLYEFRDVRDGDYTLRIGYYEFVNLDISVKGADVTVPPVDTKYHGPIWYRLTGRIVDEKGAGMEGVRIAIHFTGGLWAIDGRDLETGPDGSYAPEGKTGVQGSDGIVTFVPSKDGCVFKPDSVTVVLPWIDRVWEGGEIVIPDIVGTDYTVYTAFDYFYLSPTASWTYERTPEGGPAEEYRVSVTGYTMLDGMVYRVLSPAGPFGLTAFRIDGNSVYAIFENKRKEILKFAVVPGTTWLVGRMSGGYPVTGTFHGVETVSTPAGELPECLKYELRNNGQTSFEIQNLWFAKGSGIVRSERLLVNYGEVREHVVDVLKSRTE